MSLDFLTSGLLAAAGDDSAASSVFTPGVPSSTSKPPNRFDSSFDPWGDYLFAFVMLLIGEYYVFIP